jgi:hypothetical protein
MATRRTTLRSRTGTKLYAVRDKSGKFKDIQTYKRAHAADLRHKSKAEKEAAQGSIETKVTKGAKDAVNSAKRLVRGAVAAVDRAAKQAVKTARKMTAKGAGGKTTVKPAAKKTAKKAAKAKSR